MVAQALMVSRHAPKHQGPTGLTALPVQTHFLLSNRPVTTIVGEHTFAAARAKIYSEEDPTGRTKDRVSSCYRRTAQG
ncbi:hypothetical protein PAXRUDRAFT_487530 [Paxillus rubicundulus Ve08.2h10]|uniref:Uncharacterized protein n=1 Tax=Paxillus rubicundulus Ve08.2h10 TaxID=930991 RepID=A0A0D0DW03_9AGAM|nr:hypothetical protein PAXRUDRAFT_487530 [Paxillus rubicundulus Ve08.2h10]